MAKRLQEYVKYTKKELDSYVESAGSCVKKINADLHLSIGPYALSNFKKALLNHITRTKIGYFNIQLDGIVLDMKNIKVLGNACALRFDDPNLHININADCYVFQPAPGAVLSGIVKYIASKHVGAIIYRVFNATIRFSNTLADGDVQMDSEIKFRIKNFNMLNVFPYIEGELLTEADTTESQHSTINQIEKVKDENDIKDEKTINNDSGIEEKDTNELDEIISAIKSEITSEIEETPSPKKKKSSKGKRSSTSTANISEDVSMIDFSVKEEIVTPKKKKKNKDSSISRDISFKEEK